MGKTDPVNGHCASAVARFKLLATVSNASSDPVPHHHPLFTELMQRRQWI
jgi:hypothetical protein